MKGGFNGLKSKHLSLSIISLVCTTIFIWTWDKTSHLSIPDPPENRLVHVSSDALPGISTDMASKDNLGISTPKQGITMNASKKDVRHDQSPKEDHARQAAIPPLNSADSENIAIHSSNKNAANLSGYEGCDYARGRWVVDDRHPLYSGFGCKQWLSEMWACRLTQRTDFAYEKLAWQPKGCELEDFDGTQFLKRMYNKTLAFVGDSLGRQQFQSMMCVLTGGVERSDVLDVGTEYGLIKAQHATRPDGWAYRFPSTNTTILYYWSASLCELQPLDPSNPLTDYAMHLDRPPAFLKKFIAGFDIIVLNTGHHWNRGKLKANRWVMYVGGMPNTNRKTANIGGAKNFTIHSIVHWVDSQLRDLPGLKAFYRTISPRHFFHGDWNTGGSCDNTTPQSVGKEVTQEGSDDAIAAAAVNGTRVKLLDITALSQVRDEGHISRYSIRATPGVQDCLHWCLPGVPDTWNELLLAQI